MPFDVFVSHSTQDKLAADAVVAHLEAAGIRCWVAPRDILGGHSWARAIVGAIASVKVMVVVFSANANGSPHVRREVERAVTRGIPIVPLRIETTLPEAELEYFLSTSHWLDALTPPLEQHLGRLISSVQALLGASEGAAPAPAAREIVLPRRKYRERLRHLRLQMAATLWPGPEAGGVADNDRHARPTQEPPSSPRSRRVVHAFVCVGFGSVATLVGLGVAGMVVMKVSKDGLKAGVFDPLAATLIGVLLAILSLVATAAWVAWRRHRPWAILSLVGFALLFSGGMAVAFAVHHFQRWGNEFADLDIGSWIVGIVLLAILTFPLLAAGTLVALEHDPSLGGWSAFARVLKVQRPRWLRWLRCAGLALMVVLLLGGISHAVVIEIKERTPLSYAEDRMLEGSWQVVQDSTPSEGLAFFAPVDRHANGVTWTFARNRRVTYGWLDESRTAYQDNAFLSSNHVVCRWRVEEKADDECLVLETLLEGALVARYRMVRTPTQEPRLELTQLDGNERFLLQRVARVGGD